MTQILSFPFVWEEQLRVTSPSGSTDIVMFEGNPGAMSSFHYSYVLTKRGETGDPNAYDKHGLVLVCSRQPAATPQWIDDRNLVIPDDGGHIFYFQPHPEGFDIVAEMVSSEANPEQ